MVDAAAERPDPVPLVDPDGVPRAFACPCCRAIGGYTSLSMAHTADERSGATAEHSHHLAAGCGTCANCGAFDPHHGWPTRLCDGCRSAWNLAQRTQPPPAAPRLALGPQWRPEPPTVEEFDALPEADELRHARMFFVRATGAAPGLRLMVWPLTGGPYLLDAYGDEYPLTGDDDGFGHQYAPATPLGVPVHWPEGLAPAPRIPAPVALAEGGAPPGWADFVEYTWRRAGPHATAVDGDRPRVLAYLGLGLVEEAEEVREALLAELCDASDPTLATAVLDELGDLAFYLGLLERASGVAIPWPATFDLNHWGERLEVIAAAAQAAGACKRPLVAGRELPADRLAHGMAGVALALARYAHPRGGLEAVFAASKAKNLRRYGAGGFTVEGQRRVDAR